MPLPAWPPQTATSAVGMPVHRISEYLRYRCPIYKFENMLAAVTGLFFFAEYSND
jgi:hypothetical protein